MSFRKFFQVCPRNRVIAVLVKIWVEFFFYEIKKINSRKGEASGNRWLMRKSLAIFYQPLYSLQCMKFSRVLITLLWAHGHEWCNAMLIRPSFSDGIKKKLATKTSPLLVLSILYENLSFWILNISKWCPNFQVMWVQ